MNKFPGQVMSGLGEASDVSSSFEVKGAGSGGGAVAKQSGAGLVKGLERFGLKIPLGGDADAELHDPVVLRHEGLPDNSQVHKATGEEAISSTYRYRVSVVVAVGASVLEDYEATLVGHRAALFFTHAGARREIQGIVTQASIEGMLDDHEVSLAVDLVPELALLGMRVHSRIFQDKSAVDVVKDIFDEWGLAYDLQVSASSGGGEYAQRTYITQYQESDLAFVERLLASEGVAYFFVPGEHKETIVLCDSAAGYASVISKDGGRPTLSWSLGEMKSGDFLVRVRSERRLRPTAARIGDYDYKKPGLVLRNVQLAEDEQAAFVRRFGAEQLSVYRHGDTVETTQRGKLDGEERRAHLALAQHRRDVEMLFGATRGRRLAPGHIFALARHPVERLNREWAVTRMTVQLKRPRRQQADDGPEEYEAQFECVPSDVLLRPAVPERVIRQVSETATVTGPRGEAVFPDEHGRIKVKFHWDLSDREDDTASCWLHVAQGWVGANWGAQFVPRVGTEVVVTFLGGDPDRPLVTGAVYNGTHPPPFPLPAELTKSGLRTQSFPGDGYSELSFDDRSGSERVHLRAERDLAVLAQNDSKEEVGRDRELEVTRDLKETVGGAHSLRVVGGQAVLVEKDSDIQVGGDAVQAVTGSYDLRVSRDRTTRVEGRDRSEFDEASTSTFKDDQIVRVRGHQVTVVGEGDAQRSSSLHVEGTASSYSTGLTEIASETVLVLRCGQSSIRLTPSAVEIIGPRIFLQGDRLSGLFDEQVDLHGGERVNVTSKKRVHLAGKVAAVDLQGDARIDGTQVKLNCSPEAEPPGERKPPKPTTITLVDEEGNPLGHQRFVVVHGDGSQRGGVTDDDGEANVLLESSGQIYFPDVDDARKE